MCCIYVKICDGDDKRGDGNGKLQVIDVEFYTLPHYHVHTSKY